MLARVRLRFDFADHDGLSLRREFSAPLKIWQAHSPAGVLPLLRDCQAALDSGLTVAGFLSYEASAGFGDEMPVHAARLQNLPLAWFAAFEHAHEPAPAATGAYALSGWQPDASAEKHASATLRIKDRIAAGATYQVNHTTRLRARLSGSPAGLYHELRTRQPAPWSAFIDTGSHQLLSCSPELFFLQQAGRLVTRPMKGTARRSTDPAEDRRLAEELLRSPKERAENVMITDLLRNDMGRVARPGSVQVAQLLQVESQPTFHALTSTIGAELTAGTGLEEVMAALFPCGSVTGAPKTSTMGIIRELEPAPRGIYCGTMGFAEPEGPWAFNVAIRTVQHEVASAEVVYGTGGGITWDSDPAAEYGEALLKASFLPGAPGEWKEGRPAVGR